jgi:hypothetical protein
MFYVESRKSFQFKFQFERHFNYKPNHFFL